MAGSAAAPGWFNLQGMWEGSITAFDGEIRRRPYHRNCGCALHRSRAIPADAPCPTSCSVSYPLRRRSSSWHSLTSSSSSTNLANTTPTADGSPQSSVGGNGVAGETAFVAFTIDSTYDG